MPYITPTATPVSSRCWRISVPDDQRMLAAMLGQLLELTEVENWEDEGGISELEAADIWQEIFDEFSVGRFCMIGALVHYVTILPPDDMLECDGTQYLRVDYPELYAALPASLIIDADNFITPTIQDFFLLAAGTTHLPEDTGGAEDHTLTVAEMPSHWHDYLHVLFGLDFFSAGAPDPTGIGSPYPTLLTSSSGGDAAHNNMPPFVAYKVGIVAR